jgi:glutamate decarboxylase
MNDSEVSLSNAASMEGARERLMRLFTMSEDMRSVEQKIEARILELADEFSNSARISTEIEMGRLVETFTDNRLPCETFDVEEYIEYIATNVVAHSINTASPRYIGHMTSALPFFVRPLGKLMTAINQNLVKMETAKSFSPCERQVMAMMHRLVFNLPDDFYDIHTHRNESTLGMMTTGGTEANLAALWCARNFTLGPKGDFPGISKSGWFAALKAYGYSGAAVVGSKLIHYSFDKAADVLGLGDAGVIRVELDRNHRIDLNELQRTLRKCREERRQILALIGVAGSTDSGTVDPLNDMADVAQEYGIHFHVDAAWGGALLFSDRHRHILSGIERADSVTIDGHKQMYLPMGVGMLLIRNPQLAKVIEKQAQYVVRPGSMDLGRRTLNGSRPATVLFVHAALHIIGKLGYQFLVDQGMSKACYMADVIRRCPEFELLAEPQTNILLYRFLPENFRERAAHAALEETENQYISQVNKQLHKIQRQRGLTFVSRTTSFNNRYGSQAPIIGLRAVIANPLTTHADIDAVLQDQKGIAQQLAFHMSAN